MLNVFYVFYSHDMLLWDKQDFRDSVFLSLFQRRENQIIETVFYCIHSTIYMPETCNQLFAKLSFFSLLHHFRSRKQNIPTSVTVSPPEGHLLQGPPQGFPK